MRFIRPVIAALSAGAIGVMGMTPVMAAGPMQSATTLAASVAGGPINLGDTPREMRQATEAEQRQMDIDSLRETYPTITDAEAIAYNAAAANMTQLAYTLSTKYPDFYARHVVAPGKTYTPTLYLKGAPASVLAVVGAVNIPGLKVVNDSRFNALDQQKLTNFPFDFVNATGLVSSASATYDWDKNEVTVSVTPKNSTLAAIVALAPATVSLPAVVDIAGKVSSAPVRYITGEPVDLQVISGGTALSRGTSGSATAAICTAAFTVVGQRGDAANRRGFLTAEHCETPIAYEARIQMNAVIVYDGSVRADAKMHVTAADSIRRDFIYSKSTSGTLLTRPALAQGVAGIGDRVCVFGTFSASDRSTGRENCSNVSNTGQPKSGTLNGKFYQFYNQTETQAAITYGGDSGAPWFNGNTAFGVHSSASNSCSRTASCSNYQPISDALRKTGSGLLVD